MINAEKYKSELRTLVKHNKLNALRKNNKTFCDCCDTFCENCMFDNDKGCNYARMKWMLSEYKEGIILSRIEYEILRFIQSYARYIARDEDGNLFVYNLKPKKLDDIWDCDITGNVTYLHDLTLFNKLFIFIKWEDAEPTSIDEILQDFEVVDIE